MWVAGRRLLNGYSFATILSRLASRPSSEIAIGVRRIATDVMLTLVFALVSLMAVDIMADDAFELSDTHEGCRSCGGSNGGRAGLLSSMGVAYRVELSSSN